MSDNKEAGRMILADLKMFDRAGVLFYQEIQSEFLQAFEETIKTWTEKRDWCVEDDLDLADSGFWLAPRAWCFEEDEAEPSFSWSRDTDLDIESYALADLCGVGTGISAIWFCYSPSGKGWKKAVRSIGDKYAERLKSLGFSAFDRDENSFYLPLQLDASKLADAWMNEEYDELMEPVVTALDNLERAVPIFDEFMQELRKLVEE